MFYQVGRDNTKPSYTNWDSLKLMSVMLLISILVTLVICGVALISSNCREEIAIDLNIITLPITVVTRLITVILALIVVICSIIFYGIRSKIKYH